MRASPHYIMPRADLLPSMHVLESVSDRIQLIARPRIDHKIHRDITQSVEI
jgi:hypothetical protein